jgi:hypothetical protein
MPVLAADRPAPPTRGALVVVIVAPLVMDLPTDANYDAAEDSGDGLPVRSVQVDHRERLVPPHVACVSFQADWRLRSAVRTPTEKLR